MRNIKIIVTSLVCILCFVTAQGQLKDSDSLIATKLKGAKNLVFHYTAKFAESLPSIGQRFHVPDKIMTAANKYLANQPSLEGLQINIPVGDYNTLDIRPYNGDGNRPLYYRALSDERLDRISSYIQISEQTLMQINNMQANKLLPGQTILACWVKDDMAVEPPKMTMGMFDSVTVAKPEDPLEQQFILQTNNGQNVVVDKGAAAFYVLKGVSGNSVNYAFHNTAPRGSVIKIKNPGNGRVTYAKVIGPVPTTKQYYNCILGLSSGARRQLGASDMKLWCEVSYVGY